MAKQTNPGRPDARSSVPANGSRRLFSIPLQLLLITIIALIAYSNTFQAPFVFDDQTSITENPVIHDLSRFLSGAGYSYNPRRFIGYLTLALNYKAGGVNVAGYHIANLAIHILNGWLVHALVRLTLKTACFGDRDDPPASSFTVEYLPLFAALLFVAHPVQTQAVTYIVQRLASLATLFFLLSLVCYVKGRLVLEREGKFLHAAPCSLHGVAGSPLSFFAISLVAALLAMRTKEIAVTLPLVVMLYEFSFFKAPLRNRILFLLPLLLTILVIPVGMLQMGKPWEELLSDVSEMARESRVISRGDYLLTQFSVIATYIRLLFLPIAQNLDYDYPVYDSLFAPRVLFSFLFLLALFCSAIYLYYRSRRSARNSGAMRLTAFGILWFFITLSVESSIIPISDVIFEHRLYLPSVGAFVALTALVAAFGRNPSSRTLTIGFSVIILLLTATTWNRNLVWGSNLSLWEDSARKASEKYRPLNNLGNALNALGRYDEAIEQYQRALHIRSKRGIPDDAAAVYPEMAKPDYSDAMFNMGIAFQKQGRLQEAFDIYKGVLERRPDSVQAHNNMGTLYQARGQYDKARAEFESSIRLDPYFPDSYVNLGNLFLLTGAVDKGVEQLNAALKLNRAMPQAHCSLGVVADMRENPRQAIKHYEAALAADPGHLEACNNLGIDYGMIGMVDQAIAGLEACLKKHPEDADLHFNLANTYEMKGLTAKAAEERRRARLFDTAVTAK